MAALAGLAPARRRAPCELGKRILHSRLILVLLVPARLRRHGRVVPIRVWRAERMLRRVPEGAGRLRETDSFPGAARRLAQPQQKLVRKRLLERVGPGIPDFELVTTAA